VRRSAGERPEVSDGGKALVLSPPVQDRGGLAAGPGDRGAAGVGLETVCVGEAVRSSPISGRIRAPVSSASPGMLVMMAASGCWVKRCSAAAASCSALAQACRAGAAGPGPAARRPPPPVQGGAGSRPAASAGAAGPRRRGRAAARRGAAARAVGSGSAGPQRVRWGLRQVPAPSTRRDHAHQPFVSNGQPCTGMLGQHDRGDGVRGGGRPEAHAPVASAAQDQDLDNLGSVGSSAQQHPAQQCCEHPIDRGDARPGSGPVALGRSVLDQQSPPQPPRSTRDPGQALPSVACPPLRVARRAMMLAGMVCASRRPPHNSSSPNGRWSPDSGPGWCGQ